MIFKKITIHLYLLTLLTKYGVTKRKNACPSINNYPLIYFNPNCYYYANMDLDTPELIIKYMGLSEKHTIVAEDGYILTLFRVRQKNNQKPKKVLLLGHPLFTNSRVFIGQGKDSLTYFLWTLGYEVWLNNMRGTRFSKAHVNLTANDKKMHDFGLDKSAKYDLRAEIRYIRHYTKEEKITYVGHSMGTVKAFIYACSFPEEAKASIDRFVMMGTAAVFKFDHSPATFLAKFTPFLKIIGERMGNDMGIATNLKALNKFCYKFPPFVTLFYHFNNFFVGKTTTSDPKQINMDAFRNFDSTSLNTVLHFLQLMQVRTHLQAFDFGTKQNLKAYGTYKPPIYPIGNITIPMLFINGDTDGMTSIKDAEYLINEVMPKNNKTYLVCAPGINHLDYQIGALKYKQPFYDKIKEYLEW